MSMSAQNAATDTSTQIKLRWKQKALKNLFKKFQNNCSNFYLFTFDD